MTRRPSAVTTRLPRRRSRLIGPAGAAPWPRLPAPRDPLRISAPKVSLVSESPRHLCPPGLAPIPAPCHNRP